MNTMPTPQRDDQKSSPTDILARIEAEGITPRPRWHFLLREGLFWSLWALTIAIGALAVAGIAFVFGNLGWKYYAATHDNLLTFLAAFIPYAWILALALCVAIGLYNIRHTRRGYRYPLPVIIAVGAFASVVLGVMLHAMGFGHVVDEKLGRYIPLYRPLVIHQQELWFHPERGLLIGEVTSLSLHDDHFGLRTPEGRVMIIDAEDLGPRDLSHLTRGAHVRVVGVPHDREAELFHACFILPYEIARGMWARKEWGSASSTAEELAAMRAVIERKLNHVRSSVCRSVRPYEFLERVHQ